MLTTEKDLLEMWAREISHMFHGEVPYHVGSSLMGTGWRDIDVRLLLADDEYDALAKLVDVAGFNLALSLWGQRVTGLPIDFQVQRQRYANEKYSQHDKHLRSALSISRRDADDYAAPGFVEGTPNAK